ncbi:MAG: histidine phosphatase family protein [Propionibacteriales bacterium]|nr:histidine phosphatase family protein [Propionibacteriales bacterium]
MQILPRAERPKRLVLLRHGRTEWNRTGRAQGHADVLLDEVGRDQAQNAATQLATYEPAFVWSSDLSRARETAEQIVALTGHDIVFDKRLREYDVGVRQGLTFEEFEEQFPELFARLRAGQHVDVPGAESDDEVAERMTSVLQAAARALGDQETGVVVGHGASLRTGMLAFFDAPAELRDMIAGMANCAWAVLEQHRDRGWQIMDYNAQTLPEPQDLADDLSAR